MLDYPSIVYVSVTDNVVHVDQKSTGEEAVHQLCEGQHLSC